MGFGILCPTHTLRDLRGLSTHFLGRQALRNTQSDRRGNDSGNHVGPGTQAGPLPPYSDIGEPWKGLDVTEPKPWVLQEAAEAAMGFVDPGVTGGLWALRDGTQTSHSPCRAHFAAWALSAMNVGGSPFAELSGHPHTRCSRQGAHL